MRLFVDSSALIALFHANDKYHKKAGGGLQSVREDAHLVISDYVFDEALTFLQKRAGKAIAVRCGQWAISASYVDIIHVDDQIWRAAWEMFQAYDDKAWAFTDCTSFVLMRQMNLHRAFAFDRHFVQAGFQLWPEEIED